MSWWKVENTVFTRRVNRENSGKMKYIGIMYILYRSINILIYICIVIFKYIYLNITMHILQSVFTVS